MSSKVELCEICSNLELCNLIDNDWWMCFYCIEEDKKEREEEIRIKEIIERDPELLFKNQIQLEYVKQYNCINVFTKNPEYKRNETTQPAQPAQPAQHDQPNTKKVKYSV